jgi:hypothetical protein
MVENLVCVSVITLQKTSVQRLSVFSVVVCQHPRHPPCTNIFVPVMLAENFMKKGSRNLREFLMQFVKSRASILSNFSSICFFKSPVIKDGRPDRSSSWTFVLPSLNSRHLSVTLESFITPSSYTAVCCLWMSTARTYCTFKNGSQIALHSRRDYRFSYSF